MVSKSQRKKFCKEVLDLIILYLPSVWSHCQIPQWQQSLTEEESQSQAQTQTHNQIEA